MVARRLQGTYDRERAKPLGADLSRLWLASPIELQQTRRVRLHLLSSLGDGRQDRRR